MAEIIDLEEYRFERWYASIAWGYMTLDEMGRIFAEQLERRIKEIKNEKGAEVIKIHLGKHREKGDGNP